VLSMTITNQSVPPDSDPLTHYQREKIEQIASNAARGMSTAQLRLIRARLADLLETELPPPIAEMFRIRGRVVHEVIHDRENPQPSLGNTIKRLLPDLGASGRWCERILIEDRTLP
jgi:hypothetical protein